MQSYWGVEHGSTVAKSYIPGKGWVPATKAGKRALRGAKGAHTKARGMSPSDRRMKKLMASTSGVEDQLGGTRVKDMPLGRGKKAEHFETNTMPAGMEAFAYMSGKRRVMVTKPGADKRFVEHEKAHLKPKKRTAYRIAQFSQNPAKGMREEARADMAGNMGYRKAPGFVQSNKDVLQGKPGYSGYAAAAKGRTTARAMRSQSKQIHAAQQAQARSVGTDPDVTSAIPNRAKMFNQSSLGGYRKVQDKVDAGRGVKHKTSATTHNRINRAKDVGYPVAGAAAGTGLVAYDRKKGQSPKRRSNA